MSIDIFRKSFSFLKALFLLLVLAGFANQFAEATTLVHDRLDREVQRTLGNGLVTLLLGALIWAGWPGDSVWVVGLFVIGVLAALFFE